VCTTSVCLGSVKLYSSVQFCTDKYSPSVQDVLVQYICRGVYIYKVKCPFVCVSRLYELCIQKHSSSVQVVYSISVCEYIDVVFVDRPGPFRCPEMKFGIFI
jgi:hypothetical protein